MSVALPWHWSPWPLLRNCVPAWVRWFVGVASVLLLGIAAIAVAAKAAGFGTVMCVLVVALAWMLWFSNLLLLHMEARISCIPGLARAVGMTLLGAWLVTAMAPAAVLAWAGQEFAITLSILTMVAAGSLLLFLLPRALLVACCILPMAGRGIAHIASLPEWLRWEWQTAYWPWLAAGMVLLAAGCWHFNLRWAENANGSAWWQPLGLAKLQVAKTTHGRLAGYQEPWRIWAWLQNGRTDADPTDPVRAMRSLIGGVYAPLTRRHLLVNVVFLIVAIVLVMQLDGVIIRASLLVGIIGVGSLGPVAYAQQLGMLYSQQARELVELALLPGWGDAEQTRITLLRALAWPPLRLLLSWLILVPVMLAVLHVALPLTSIGLLVLIVIVSVLLTALVCLRPIAGLSIAGMKGGAIFLPSLILVVLGAMHVAFEGEGTRYCALLSGALLSVGIAYALAVRAAWRRFLRRPHPFLQD